MKEELEHQTVNYKRNLQIQYENEFNKLKQIYTDEKHSSYLKELY